jgi:hypothetical protein
MDDPSRTSPFMSVASLMRREPSLAERRLIEPRPQSGSNRGFAR